MADLRMADRRQRAAGLLDQQPPHRRATPVHGHPRPLALEDRAGLPRAQRPARPGPLRRTLLPRLVSPHRAGHRRARVPDPGAAAPKSPAAGLTLPKAVLLMQPLFKCWDGRCSTCQQPIDIDDIPLTRTTPQIEKQDPKVLLATPATYSRPTARSSRS